MNVRADNGGDADFVAGGRRTGSLDRIALDFCPVNGPAGAETSERETDGHSTQYRTSRRRHRQKHTLQETTFCVQWIGLDCVRLLRL